jgi:Bacteriocin-protection, YdeI or OmpD-Associated
VFWMDRWSAQEHQRDPLPAAVHPRKPKSNWSAVNLSRASELAKLGLMASAGMKAFEQRSIDSGKYSFESRPDKLPVAYQKEFKANPAAWEFFRAQAPWYQRTSSFWVVSAKQEQTRQRRLATLISDSGKRRRLGMLTPKRKNRKIQRVARRVKSDQGNGLISMLPTVPSASGNRKIKT